MRDASGTELLFGHEATNERPSLGIVVCDAVVFAVKRS